MLTFIGNFKEFCSEPQGLPSIKEFFSTKPYKDKDKVIRYLRNGGIEDMFSMAIQKDCITGEIIPGIDIGRNDGEYTWWTSLAYYVERYNLRLPTEFEKKALEFSARP